MLISFLTLSLCAGLVNALTYSVQVESIEPTPVLSYVQRSSAFQQIFNPSYVVATPGSGGVEGIVARTQNCSASVGGGCVGCGGAGEKARCG